MEKIKILILNEKITTNYINFVHKNNIGAIISFTGTVREMNNFKKVKHILYETFDELAKELIYSKCLSYIKKENSLEICVVQRTGVLKVGEINLIISVGSEHRKNAFLYCEELLEFFKKEVPVWKKEFYEDGTYKWINSDV